MNQERFELFSKAYRAALTISMFEHPDDYGHPNGVPAGHDSLTADKVLFAMSNNPMGVNYGGRGFAAACKALKIKSTRKAIFEFLEVDLSKL